jgi:hypothetical protein
LPTFEKVMRTVSQCYEQELRIESQNRTVDPARTDGISRFDMDTFIWMAEHVAIRGLDDEHCSPGQHYLSALPSTVSSEPYTGYLDPSKGVGIGSHGPRRIECLAAAHQHLRSQAEKQLQELRSRPSSSEQEISAVVSRLERLGEYPCLMEPANTDAAWHSMREYASLVLLPAARCSHREFDLSLSAAGRRAPL